MKRRTSRIGYARVSSEDQKLALQLDALKAAGCTHVFCDEISGASRGRPALQEALGFLQPGDTLVTWKLDRLGRSLGHLIDLKETLGSDRVEYRSLMEAMDTTTAHGEFVFHVLGAVAQYERRIIGERTSAGMAAAKARGARLGRPRKLTAQQVTRAKSVLRRGRTTLAALAAKYEVSPVTLARALKRPE